MPGRPAVLVGCTPPSPPGNPYLFQGCLDYHLVDDGLERPVPKLFSRISLLLMAARTVSLALSGLAEILEQRFSALLMP